MPQDPAAVLSSLLRASSITDHEEILRAANAALKANKTDFASRHTRVVALLKLDRYDDALRAIAEGGTKLGAICGLENAYALYKTGKLDEATALLQATGLSKRGFTHVAAQVAYRAERFDESLTIYRRLLDTDENANEENDLHINLRAASAQAEWQGFPSANLPRVQDSDGFELCYNAACAFIARGDANAAAELLQRALGACDASDDLTKGEKEAEMRPIQAQQAFVYAKQGKLNEALELYRSLSTTSDNDADFPVIVQNNLLAIEGKPENPYLLQRHFEIAKKGEKAARLYNYQSHILQSNGLVIGLQTNKSEGVKKRTNKILNKAQHPTAAADVNVSSVLNAAAGAQGADEKQVIRGLTTLISKRPHDVGLALTIVQLQLQNDLPGAALSTLDSFLQRLEKAEGPGAKDIRFGPGLVALAVALMRAQGRESSAKSELAKAAKHWQHLFAGPAASLLREAGVELLRSSNHQDLELAGSSFQKLFDEQQGSHIASAGLVASLAPIDPTRIKQHLADLPPVESLVNGVDVAGLISAGVATAVKSSQALKRSAPDTTAVKTSKRRRKIKLPKNYEEGKKPDPERWLPLRDRSTYRPKGKKGKKKALDTTQGGIIKEEETLELVGGGGVKVEKAPTQNSKKKKKGKK
ncbi:Fc.00g006040.m01.CDS01 [Cosmosporella sp. VM-42]